VRITEDVEAWRADVLVRIAGALGLEKVMVEAADPQVFAGCVDTSLIEE